MIPGPQIVSIAHVQAERGLELETRHRTQMIEALQTEGPVFAIQALQHAIPFGINRVRRQLAERVEEGFTPESSLRALYESRDQASEGTTN